MKRRGALTVVVVAGAAALVAVFAGTGSADHPGSTTLTFVERVDQGTFRFIDNPPKARGRSERVSPGDMFVGSNVLYNAANTRREGKILYKCTAILGKKRFARSTFLCEATARLANGTLALTAVLKGQDPAAGPVVGGSGAYEGASGSYVTVPRRRTIVDTFHFDTD
jgi:hypothetical protein